MLRRIVAGLSLLLAVTIPATAVMTCRVTALADDGLQRVFLASTRLADGTLVGLVSSRLVDSAPGTALVKLVSFSPAGESASQMELAGVDPMFITGMAPIDANIVAVVWRSREAVVTVSFLERSLPWKRSDHQIGIPGLLPLRVTPASKGILLAGRVLRTGAILHISSAGVVTNRLEIRDPAITALYDVREERAGTMVFLAGAPAQASGKRLLLLGRIKQEGEIIFKEVLSSDFHVEARLAEGPKGIYALFQELIGGKARVVSILVQERLSERSEIPMGPVLAGAVIDMTPKGDIVVAGFTNQEEFWLLGRPAAGALAFERCVPALSGGRQDFIGDFRPVGPGSLAVSHSSVIERQQRAQLRQLLKLVSIEWK